MVVEDYVSFEIAKLLKEKGFDEYGMYFYTLKDGGHEGYKSNKRLGEFAHNSDPDLKDRAVSCPTLQMAMKWLRDEHNIYIIIEPHLFKEKKAIEYCFNYWADGHYHMPYNESYPVYHPLYAKTWESYEEACEASIKYCLENLI